MEVLIFLVTCINFAEQQIKISHLEGSIITEVSNSKEPVKHESCDAYG